MTVKAKSVVCGIISTHLVSLTQPIRPGNQNGASDHVLSTNDQEP